MACAFRDPFEPLPYLFLWGNENSGKSILHEALELLVTKGVVKADKVLKSNNEFNRELAGAIICAVEEKALTPAAHDRIKEYVPPARVAIREMRTNVYQVPNTTHWIQTSNKKTACPVASGDTRITVIAVRRLFKEEIPSEMEARLKEEASHFLYTLLNMPLPPLIERLRLPMVATQSKAETAELNKTSLQRFIDECCQLREGPRTLRFSEFYDAFQQHLDAGEKHEWSKRNVTREMPNQHSLVLGHAGYRYVQDLVLRAPDSELK